MDDITTIRLLVNSDDAEKKLISLRAKLERLEQEKQNFIQINDQGNLNKTLREIKKVEREMRGMTARSVQLEQTMQHLDRATPRELRETISVIYKEMNSGKVARNSAQWEALSRQLVAAKAALQQVNGELSAVKEARKPLADYFISLTEAFNQINWAGQALDNLSNYVKGYITQAAAMKEAEAEVAKYTGLSAAQVEELNEELQQLDTRTPRERLNELAADAGRLGIQGKDAVLDFVRAADQINLALGADLGEDGVKNIGKLAQLFEPNAPLGQSMLRTASLINDLAQSSSASEGYILDFTARLAGVGRQAGISQANIAGFASVLDQSMIGQERAATALSNVITAIYRHPAEMAKKAGLDVKEFTSLLQTDANAALLQFIGALSSASSLDSIAPMLDDMKLSGSGVTQTLSVLAAQIDNVRSTQEQAATAYRQGTSATDEAAKSNSTLQAELEKSQNRTAELAVALGNELTPVLRYLTSTSSLVIRAFTLLLQSVKAHPIAYITAAVALGGYTLAVKAHTIATTLWTRATTLMRSLMGLYLIVVEAAKFAYYRLTGATLAAANAHLVLGIALKATPWGAIIGAVVALVGVIATMISSTRSLTAEQRGASQATADLIEVQKKATESTIEEKKRIELLNAIIHDNARSIADRKRAITDLRKIIPNYHGEISREGKLIRDNAKAIDTYIERLDKMALAEALYEKIKENAAKKVHADLAIQSWKQGIKNRESLMKSKGHESEKETVTLQGGYAPSSSYEVETNELRLEDERQMSHNKSRLKFWEDQRKAIEATDRSYQAYIKQQGLGEAMEQVMLGRGAGNSPAGTSHADSGGGGGTPPKQDKPTKNGNTPDPDKEAKERLRKELDTMKQHAQLRNDVARLEYLRGKMSKRQYEEEMLDIEDEHLARQLTLYKEGTTERVAVERKQDELLEKIFEQRRAWSLEQIETERKEEEEAARAAYLSSAISEEDYQHRLDDIKLRALQRRADTTRQWLGEEHKETRSAAREAEAESTRQQLELHKNYQQKLRSLRDAYAEKPASERMAEELKQLDELHKAKLVSEEEYQKLVVRIKAKYQGSDGKGGEIDKERKEAADKAMTEARRKVTGNGEETNIAPSSDALGVGAIGAAAARIKVASQMHAELSRLEAQGVITHQQAEDAKKRITEQHYENIRTLASAAFASVGAIAQQLTQLNNAERDAELAQIERHYSQRIKFAGNNSQQTKQLEEQKQAEMAKVKTQYAQREAKMQIAQAIAQTAVNAISAYGSVVKVPFVGPVLAIAASAAAVAAGAIQIATIRKQAEAQATGYYVGGFTGGRRYRKAAGVVHEGEFVANHEAVNNPQLLPVLQLIDRAQRSHRVAHLTASDISAVVTQPHVAAATSIAHSTTAAVAQQPASASPTPITVQAESPRTADAIERLAASLEAGITATVALSGRDGLHEQYTRYQRNLERK